MMVMLSVGREKKKKKKKKKKKLKRKETEKSHAQSFLHRTSNAKTTTNPKQKWSYIDYDTA